MILIIEDEKTLAHFTKKSLEKEYKVKVALTGKEGLEILKKEEPEIIILDIRLPDINGLEILKRARKMYPDIIVTIITADLDVKTAVDAMKSGAYDYLVKPFNMDSLKHSIKMAMDNIKLKIHLSHLKKKEMITKLVAKSPAMNETLKLIDKVASSNVTVLLTGESGTGKGVLAKYTHQISDRKEKPFAEINCSAIPENLLESELFGYEKGAFTDAKTSRKGLFDIANQGTIFLDEIGDMPIGMQTKILKVLEEKSYRRLGGGERITVDVRIITATNQDIEKLVQENRFRQDLYYRIKVFPISIKPLRERKEDIIPLVEFFISEFIYKFTRKINGITKEFEEKVLTYNWPGNIRELKNIIERAIIISKKDLLDVDTLPKEILLLRKTPFSFKKLDIENGLDLEDEINKIKLHYAKQAMNLSKNNISKAAKFLNISRRKLMYFLQEANYE